MKNIFTIYERRLIEILTKKGLTDFDGNFIYSLENLDEITHAQRNTLWNIIFKHAEVLPIDLLAITRQVFYVQYATIAVFNKQMVALTASIEESINKAKFTLSNGLERNTIPQMQNDLLDLLFELAELGDLTTETDGSMVIKTTRLSSGNRQMIEKGMKPDRYKFV